MAATQTPRQQRKALLAAGGAVASIAAVLPHGSESFVSPALRAPKQQVNLPHNTPQTHTEPWSNGS
eukprot:2933896-Amphidinium_carterae.1